MASGFGCAPEPVARLLRAVGPRAALDSRHKPMLPAANRLRRHQDIVATVRRGRRISRGCVVIHVVPGEGITRVAFAVGRNVGPSGVRSRVTRRLRHQVAELIPQLKPGLQVVVRALPSAAAADSHRLSRDLVGALTSMPGALQ